MISCIEAIRYFEDKMMRNGMQIYMDSVDFGFFLKDEELDEAREAFRQLRDEGINYKIKRLGTASSISVSVPVEIDEGFETGHKIDNLC